MTDDQLAPPVKHFFNQYAKGFTRVSGTTGRRASISAAQGNGGFLAKDFLVRPLVLSSPRPPPTLSHPRTSPHPAQDQVSSELMAVSPTTNAPPDKPVLLYLTEEGQSFAEGNFTYFPKTSDFR